MTLIELQEILGERIKITNKDFASSEERKAENEKSDMIARLAKQMINNADIILRTDKLVAEGKLENTTIVRVIGNENNQRTD